MTIRGEASVTRLRSRRASTTSRGSAIGIMDMLIAAIALSRDVIVITSNSRGFSRVKDLSLENWIA